MFSILHFSGWGFYYSYSVPAQSLYVGDGSMEWQKICLSGSKRSLDGNTDRMVRAVCHLETLDLALGSVTVNGTLSPSWKD